MLLLGLKYSPHIAPALCFPSSLAALVYAPLSCPSDEFTKNVLVRSTFKIWKQMRHHFGWQTMFPKFPIHCNHVFKPTIMDKSLTVTFCSFQQICKQFKILKIFFVFATSRFVILYIKYSHCSILPPRSPFDHILEDPLRWRGIILTLHCKILTPLY